MNFAEKRRHPRLSIYSAALIALGAEGYLSEVKDISRSGARVARPKIWPVTDQTECRVFFIFDEETVISMAVRIARTSNDDLGLEFLGGQESQIENLLYESRFLDQEAL